MSKNETKKILIALDIDGGSKKLIDKTIRIAKLSGAVLLGLHVVAVQSTLASAVINYKKYLTKKTESSLESTKKYCEKKGIEFEPKILYGSPGVEIAKFANEQKVDLVVVGSKGLGGIREAILGSVPNTVIHKSKTSVLVIK